jgi:glycosyltransferase involved in cell wall biosynthesis
MRFLMLNWRDPRNPLAGGAERVTQGYLNALAERGHDVCWFANAFAGAPVEEPMGKLRIVRGGGMGRSILEARRWFKLQPRFDLVIDQHHGIPWYAPWWCGTRCVAYIHEVLGPIWDVFYRPPWNVIGRRQERWTHWLYRKVPFWTACQATGDCLRAHGVRDVTIIPYGVATVALPVLEAKPLEAPLRLITVSRLAPNKRVDHAIHALRCLTEMGVRAEMTIVGGGMHEGLLKQLAAELGLADRARFTGPLSEANKDAALRRAHFLLHTSQREGWGLNVIEANALGTPAVVYPVAGLTESTLHGQTGLVAEAETPAALAAAIRAGSGSADSYERYRRQGWERAKTFHWNVVLPRACEWLEGQARPAKLI